MSIDSKAAEAAKARYAEWRDIDGRPTLPEDFWKRPSLDHIRQAARSEELPPDALFGAAAAVAVAQVPPQVVLTKIKRVGSLNLNVVLNGQPSEGKGAICDEAEALMLPDDHTFYDVRISGIGSGEGMLDKYFLAEKKRGEDFLIEYEQCLFRVDEAAALKAMKNRQGETTSAYMRQAFMAERIDPSTRASQGKHLPPHAYRWCSVAAAHPDDSAWIMTEEERAVGGPQRLTFFSMLDDEWVDPRALPSHPGPFPLDRPWRDKPTWLDGLTSLRLHGQDYFTVPLPLSVEREARTLLREARYADDVAEHAVLKRHKWAAALSVLDGRLLDGISEEDWYLAGLVVETSASGWLWLNARNAKRGQERDRARGHSQARTEEAKTEYRSKRMTRAVAAVEAQVKRHAEVTDDDYRTHAKGDPCTARCIAHALRGYAGLTREDRDEIREMALDDRVIEKRDGGYVLGPMTARED